MQYALTIPPEARTLDQIKSVGILKRRFLYYTLGLDFDSGYIEFPCLGHRTGPNLKISEFSCPRLKPRPEFSRFFHV